MVYVHPRIPINILNLRSIITVNATFVRYNFMEDAARVDAGVLHGGCPVLKGEKWSKFVLRRMEIF